jgi:hypothetical protein
MKVVNVFKVNNIDYSIIETNKNNTFVIPNNCFYLSNSNNISINVDLFKTTDSHNYELFLKINESEEELKIIEILKKNNKTEILDLEKEIGTEKLVNSYVEEYFKDKNKSELSINYDNYIIAIRNYKDIYSLSIRTGTGEFISTIYNDKEDNNPYKLLTDFNKNYTIYFNKTMLKYKVNMINHIKSIFENNYSYPKSKYCHKYEELTNDKIISIFKNEDAEEIHMNLGTENFINKLVEIIDSEIIFVYTFGEIKVNIRLDKREDTYTLSIYTIYNFLQCRLNGTNAYKVLNDALTRYYDGSGCLKEKSNNYMMNYLESILK